MIRLSAALCVIAFAAPLSACKPETPPVASAVPGLLIDCDLLKPRSRDGNAQATCRQPQPDVRVPAKETGPQRARPGGRQ